ncbi:MerR family transcriptional regulator [Aequorivita echinoideorum]|uniref:MerR family transcriptional regulator n=1 Tax=Aequorivita echinoideorum TaxID=1549647 RepID=A0ABS5S717_9FLAO|nr:MerR family transcriptional regulator [Aequorivita echinoideorum]MBT0609011.1 MerR family transcriptional regulator [Aequorivita echinoideorum]
MVKTEFGIKDLENLSHIKAHTIRIWEKRYKILQPERSNTNIRKYNLDNLKKLLNVVFLYNSGHKISAIANLTPEQIQNLINSKIGRNQNYPLQVFKSTMFDFNTELFNATFENLLKQKSLGEIFEEIFIPLLNEIGVLWHNGTVEPAHEHFISEMVKHKLIAHTALLPKSITDGSKPTFVLYLPLAEIHEIGLLYANYEIISEGFKTIYLGPNLSLENLSRILDLAPQLIFVTSLTLISTEESIMEYIDEFQNRINFKRNLKMWIIGKKIENMPNKHDNILFFGNVGNFKNHLQNLNKT